LDDREALIIDDNDNEDDDFAQSDLVRIALNLAFIRKEYLEEFMFKFDPETCIRMKKDAQA